MSENNIITIPKKALAVITPVIAITAVLFARGKAPEVLLFLIGVGCGIFIGKALSEKKQVERG